MEGTDIRINGEDSGETNLKSENSIKETSENIAETLELNKRKIEDIKYVFQMNPQLSEIGTMKQYDEYLDTIFPNTKFKDIVYHRSDADFKEEGFKPMKPNFDTVNSVEGIFNFSTNTHFISRYGKNTYAVVLNIQSPLREYHTGEFMDDIDLPLSFALFKIGIKKENNPFAPRYNESFSDTDGFINEISGEYYIESHPKNGKEMGLPQQTVVSVFDSNKIHILGSQKDIDNFRNFVENRFK